jgi:Flp pilus assembly protein TadG
MIAAGRKKFGARWSAKHESGQAQVEFVLSILFVLLLIAGIVELIVLIHTYTVLADSAKEGVRYAVVHGCDLTSGNCSGTCGTACTDATGNNVKAWVRSYAQASLHDTSAMTIGVNYLDASSDAPNRVRVTVSYPYQPLFGLGWPTVTVHAAAEGRIVY